MALKQWAGVESGSNARRGREWRLVLGSRSDRVNPFTNRVQRMERFRLLLDWREPSPIRTAPGRR